jgi:hypothetical protein
LQVFPLIASPDFSELSKVFIFLMVNNETSVMSESEEEIVELRLSDSELFKLKLFKDIMLSPKEV